MKTRSIFIAAGAALLIAIVAGIAAWLNDGKLYEGNTPFASLSTDTRLIVRYNRASVYVKGQTDTQLTDKIEDLVYTYSDKLQLRRDTSFYGVLNTSMRTLADTSMSRAVYTVYYDGASILSFALKNNSERRLLISSLEDTNEPDTTVNGTAIMKVKSSPLWMTVKDGCIFYSHDKNTLASVASEEGKKLVSLQSFGTLMHTASDASPLSVFVRDFEEEDKGDVWTELDVDIVDSRVVANGMSSSETASTLSYVVATESAPIVIDKYIPSSVVDMQCFVKAQRGLANESYLMYLKKHNKEEQYRELQSTLNDRCKADIEALLSELFANELALVSLDIDNPQKSQCLFLMGDNGTVLQGALNELLVALNNGSAVAQVDELSPLSTVAVPVYRAFNSKDELFFLSDLLSTDNVPYKYYLRFDNCLLFANDVNILRRVLYENMQNRTMANDAAFRNFRSLFPERCSAFMWKKCMMRDTDVCKTIGWQTTKVNNLPYICLNIDNNTHLSAEPPTRWQAHLDADIVGKPFAVVNHYTQSTEYLVQDAENYIYLINSDGLTLWKRKVDGKIVGEVVQIDYYRNKKLQYLFATENTIQLIDRNGNNTADFPIKLKAKATSGVSYIMYNDSRDFRLFVSCDNKTTCLYGPDTKHIEGWKIPSTEGLVTQPVQHEVALGKDYILMQDNLRTYILDRKGNERIKLSTFFAPNPQSNIYFDGVGAKGPVHFVTSTVDGMMAMIEIPTGEVKTCEVPEMKGKKHHLIHVGKSKFVAVTDSLMIEFDSHKGIVERQTPIYVGNVSDISQTNDGQIVIYDAVEHLTYLYNMSGKLAVGYPKPAYSPMVQTNNSIVVAGANGALNCFMR